MKASLAIARYQWAELLLRWRAQPASPLARWFLTFALAAAGAVLLLGFAAADSARQTELRRLGLDTIVVQAPSESVLPGSGFLPADHWAAPLEGQGELVLLQQLPAPAVTPWGEAVPVFAAPIAFVSRLAGPAGHRGADAVWVTRILPAGRRFALGRGSLSLAAITVAPSGSIQALGLDDCVLVAPEGDGGSDPRGRIDVVLFTPRAGQDAAGTVQSVRRLFAAGGGDPPVIRDPSPYRAAMESFARSQERWRRGLSLLLCLCVVLTFGSIGMLEEKQTRYTQALLRSLGVPGATLWCFSLLENALIANTALLSALGASRLAAQALLSLTGSSLALPSNPGGPVLLWLACAVNAGVLLSLVPLARALRRPVGVVLP